MYTSIANETAPLCVYSLYLDNVNLVNSECTVKVFPKARSLMPNLVDLGEEKILVSSLSRKWKKQCPGKHIQYFDGFNFCIIKGQCHCELILPNLHICRFGKTFAQHPWATVKIWMIHPLSIQLIWHS